MSDKPEYDELDVSINRWLGGGKMPVPTMELRAEMVEFYKTPAKVVLEMVERLRFGPGDVFVDLGSGLGQVVLLVHLLTGVRALGVEIEPAYCAYAQQCAEKLGVQEEVGFMARDVREVDLTDGTIFFLFTPFRGKVFDEVMGQLAEVAALHRIWVIGYGPCSRDLARVGWLEGVGDGATEDEYKLQFFKNAD